LPIWSVRKIIKIVAIRSHILKVNRAKFDFGWGSAPYSAGRAHSAPRFTSWISGVGPRTSKEKEGRRSREERKIEGKDKEQREKERRDKREKGEESRGGLPNFWLYASDVFC